MRRAGHTQALRALHKLDDPTPAHGAKAPPLVFVSYRRKDSGGHMHALSERLSEAVGGDSLFIDVNAIEHGTDFERSIWEAMDRAAVVLVVIGDRWLSMKDKKGRRIRQADDYVHREVAAALERDIRVIPVLVNGARLPKAEQLPGDIAPLANRKQLALTDDQWAADVELARLNTPARLRGCRPASGRR